MSKEETQTRPRAAPTKTMCLAAQTKAAPPPTLAAPEHAENSAHTSGRIFER